METIFGKDKIPTFNYKDLHGKVLEIYVNESEEAIVVNGIDIKTGTIYVLFSAIKQLCTTGNYAKKVNVLAKCQLCGELIESGEYCQSCSMSIQDSYKQMEREEAYRKEMYEDAFGEKD